MKFKVGDKVKSKPNLCVKYTTIHNNVEGEIVGIEPEDYKGVLTILVDVYTTTNKCLNYLWFHKDDLELIKAAYYQGKSHVK